MLYSHTIIFLCHAYTHEISVKYMNDNRKCHLCVCVQSHPTLYESMDCSLPGSYVHGIFQARILEWVAISFSRDLPDPGIKP